MFSLRWQRSYSLLPVSFRMMHLPAVVAVVVSGAAADIMAACVPAVVARGRPMYGAADMGLLAVDTGIGPFRVAPLHARQCAEELTVLRLVAVLIAEPMGQQPSARRRPARPTTTTATTTIVATMTAT